MACRHGLRWTPYVVWVRRARCLPSARRLFVALASPQGVAEVAGQHAPSGRSFRVACAMQRRAFPDAHRFHRCGGRQGTAC
jgi:hypothetical protein